MDTRIPTYETPGSPASPEAMAALAAIYQDAHRLGHREGYFLGIAEKAWIDKHGPAVILVAWLIGVAIGAAISWGAL